MIELSRFFEFGAGVANRVSPKEKEKKREKKGGNEKQNKAGHVLLSRSHSLSNETLFTYQRKEGK
jgi:hypothetical protein